MRGNMFDEFCEDILKEMMDNPYVYNFCFKSNKSYDNMYECVCEYFLNKVEYSLIDYSINVDKTMSGIVFFHSVLGCFVIVSIINNSVLDSNIEALNLCRDYYDGKSELNNKSVGILIEVKNSIKVMYIISRDNIGKYESYLPTEEEIVSIFNR